MCNHHQVCSRTSEPHQQKTLLLPFYSPPPAVLSNDWCTFCLYRFPCFWTFIYDVVFCNCLLSFSIMFSRFILVAYVSASLLFMAEYSIVQIYYNLLTSNAQKLIMDGFYLMVIMNNATIHILVQVSAEAYIFIYLGTAWSYGHAMFNGLRNCQAVFQSSYAILHSHQQCRRVPISPLSCQYIFILTDFSLPSECEVVSFQNYNKIYLFMCYFPCRNGHSDEMFCSLHTHINYIQVPYQKNHLQIFSPILWASSHS